MFCVGRLTVIGMLMLGCGRVETEAHPTPERPPDASTDASPDGAVEASAEAGTEAATDASDPPQAELVANLHFVEAMRLASDAVFVAERSYDPSGETRRILRIDAQTGAITLVTDDVQGTVTEMVVTADRVVWAEYHCATPSCIPDSSIRAVPVVGGAVDLIAPFTGACAMALGGGWLWLVDNNELKRLSLETGELVGVLESVSCALAATDTQVYFGHGTKLAVYDIATSSSSDVVDSGGYLFASRIHDGFWYWMAGGVNSAIHRVPTAGGPAAIVAQGPLFLLEFGVQSHLFWLEQGVAGNCDGRVMRGTLTGSAQQIWATGCWPYAIATNDQYIYFVENIGDWQSLLRRAPLE